MKYRKMGSLPWQVSALGFGCMRLPSRGFLRGVDEKKAVEIIRLGIDKGINYLDTAWVYHLGQSEKVIGLALKDGYREKVRIATKLPMILMREADAFERYLNQQLERLQIGCIDVYLLHGLNQGNFAKVKRMNLMDKMEKAREEGKIKHIGFSFHDTLPVFREIIDYYPWDMTQVQYNYMDATVQASDEGLKYAHAKGIAVVVMEPLKGGQLSRPPQEALDVMKAAPVQRTPVDWALQYVWNRPEVACLLSGMGTRKMVEENCASADASGAGTLSAAEIRVVEQLAAIYRKNIAVPCTACGYCMPCPSGVDIPQNFALLNNKTGAATADFQGKVRQWLLTRNYRKLAKSKKDLPKKNNRGGAALCTRCNACIPKCPQKIMIPDELEKVKAAFR
ncbi:MAG TPA: aldo/keto reductase [Chitinivibrionales bacterium]|nr:aldo/keto reductase [Chitinivibrionales bacterium]